MFLNLLHLFTRPESTPEEYDFAFVKDVSVHKAEPRNRRVEKWLIIGWLLIALKSVVVFWAIAKYRVPINPWWIVAPTIVMAAVCTVLYAWRR